MKYIFIIAYFLLFCLLMRKWKLFQNSGMPYFWLCGLFGLKVVAGLAYGKLFLDYYGGGDPYRVFKAGLHIFQSFSEDPAIYFRLVFGPNGGFAEIPVYKYAFRSNYWDHAGFYNLARLHAILRPVSFGYYSVHITFMAFFMMIAGIHFYRLLRVVGGFSKWPVLAVIFLMPSLLFWTGGFHKDGFVYLGISIMLYHTWGFRKNVHFKHVIWVILGLTIVYMARPFQLVFVLPPLFLILLTQKWPDRAFWKFGLGYLGLTIVILITNFLIRSVNLFEILAGKQHAFLVESGQSKFLVRTLEPDLLSFITFFPTAFINAFFRPFLWNIGGPIQMISMLGVLSFWAFAIFALCFRRRDFRWDPVFLFLLFYSISNIILIGYLVSNTGTLVRYRAVSLNFLLMILVFVIDWKRLGFTQK